MFVDDTVIENMTDAVVYGETNEINIPLVHDKKGGVEFEVQLIVTRRKKKFITDNSTGKHYEILDYVKAKQKNNEECYYEQLKEHFVNTLKWNQKSFEDKYTELLKKGEIFEVEDKVHATEL